MLVIAFLAAVPIVSSCSLPLVLCRSRPSYASACAVRRLPRVSVELKSVATSSVLCSDDILSCNTQLPCSEPRAPSK